MKKAIVFLCCLSLGIIFCSCGDKDDDDTDPTPDTCTTLAASFSADVMPIIELTCAIPDCHVAGFDSGDFTTYEGVKERVDNGSFATRVTNQSMPPSNTLGPESLTDDEIELINCWVDDGAEDN